MRLSSRHKRAAARSDSESVQTSKPSRRGFISLSLAGAASTVMATLAPAVVAAAPARWYRQLRLSSAPGSDHPDPRPGIDGSGVLAAEQLTNAPHLVELFDAVREIPHIADGLLCYCGCARVEGYRSLLSCYEAPGMAQYCEICQGQARLAHGRWKEGQTLDQIRRATDARYGHGGDTDDGSPESCSHS